MIVRASEKKKAYVHWMFNAIAPRYDFLNHLLSYGLNIFWRRKAIELLRPFQPKRILDIATGTADFAIAALRLHPMEVIGVDIAEEMLKIGKEKIRKRNLNGVVKLDVGDAEQLKFESASFDAVLVAFGVRNFENLEKGLSEIHRVLKLGGVAVILEFSRPRKSPFKQVYSWYMRRVVPAIGGWISKHREAYEYLPETIWQFPDGEDFLAILRQIGFLSASAHPLTFGVATIYRAQKSSYQTAA